VQDEKLQLIRDAFMAFLLLQRVPQKNVAKIVRVDLNRVNELAKLLKNQKRSKGR
jgi:hypothetical protein